MRICRNCKSTMEDGMMFCPECGVKYISFDEQIYASENFPVVIAEQNVFLDDGRPQAVILFGNVGEKTISACAIRLKCFDAFGAELADKIVKYTDFSAEPQEVFGDDKLIEPEAEDTRKVHVIVEMLVFEDGTKWNGTVEEWKPSNAYDAFKTIIKNNAIQTPEYWKDFFAISYAEANKIDIQKVEHKQKILKDNPDVVLPYGITEIPFCAFNECSNLTSIKIPDSVTSIGSQAFRKCSGLNSITIPDSVTSIGGLAFLGCSSLTSITIPDSVTDIDDAFSGCSGITSITIPNSVTSISYGAFRDCSSLTSITIPDSVTYIGDRAFEGCSNLTSITIPDSVITIHEKTFADCTSLTNVTIKNPMCKIASTAFSNTPYEKSQQKRTESASKSGGCYIATCVYGSYNCPQVWTLRRYRDNTLAETWHGRAFIRAYYAISPTIVKLFGNTKWFHKMCKGKLDKMVSRLQKSGYESTPYEDRKW